eukprot:g16162.t1
MQPSAIVECQEMLAVTKRLFSYAYALNHPTHNWRRTRFQSYLVRNFVVYQNRPSLTSYRRQFRTVLVDNFQIKLQTPLHVSRLSSNLYRDDHTYRQLYRRFDRYNDGKIGVDEFVSRSRELGLQVTEQEIEILYSKFEFKTKGEMDFEEFKKFMDDVKNIRPILLEKSSEEEEPGDSLSNSEGGSSAEQKLGSETNSKWSYDNFKQEAVKEYRHYKRGFTLLYRQLTFAKERLGAVLEGRELSRYEYRKVMRAMTDVLRLLPMICLVALPGGSILLPLVAKKFPQVLPTTFHEKNMPHKRKVDLVTLEVAAAIDEMERKVRKENQKWKGDDVVYLKLKDWVESNSNAIPSLDLLDAKTGQIRKECPRDLLEKLGAEGLVDRLESDVLKTMMLYLVPKTRAKALSQTPVPIIRALVKRHVRKVVEKNDMLRVEIQQKGLEKVLDSFDATVFCRNRCVELDMCSNDLTAMKRVLAIWSNISSPQTAIFAIYFNASRLGAED